MRLYGEQSSGRGSIGSRLPDNFLPGVRRSERRKAGFERFRLRFHQPNHFHRRLVGHGTVQCSRRQQHQHISHVVGIGGDHRQYRSLYRAGCKGKYEYDRNGDERSGFESIGNRYSSRYPGWGYHD